MERKNFNPYRGMKKAPIFVVFKDGYFDGMVDRLSLIEAKTIVKLNPDNAIRIQTVEGFEYFRLLLHPSHDGGKTRKIDAHSDLALLYLWFNNLTEDGKSHIQCDEKGPGGIYISNPVEL